MMKNGDFINAYERYINNFQIGLFKQKMLEVYRKL